MIQYLIIGLVVAACIVYAAIRIYKAWHGVSQCKDYKCAGCPFYQKCEQNKKKRVQR